MFKHLKSVALVGLVVAMGLAAVPGTAKAYGERDAVHLGRHHGPVVVYHHHGGRHILARHVPLRRLIRAARWGEVACYHRPVRSWRHREPRWHHGRIPVPALARLVRVHGGRTIHCYRIR